MALSNLVTYTDMVGGLAIDLTDTSLRNDFSTCVAKYQRDILISLLGIGLYSDFYNNDTASKYTTLKNGVTNGIYTYSSEYYEFSGVTEMLKYFIFFYYNRKGQSFNTPLGERKTIGDNVEAGANLRVKCVENWNYGVKLYYEAIDYINYANTVTADTYPDFEPKNINFLTIF